MLIVDPLFQKEQKWKPQHLQKAIIKGAVGNQETQIAPVPVRLHVEGSTFQFPWYVVLDVRGILGRYADGIVGSKDIKRHPFEINYQHHFLRLLPEVPDSVKKDAVVLPLIY